MRKVSDGYSECIKLFEASQGLSWLACPKQSIRSVIRSANVQGMASDEEVKLGPTIILYH